ncbi:MAG: zf-HC2 domain-containing protein [Vicinamibacterales bacterium]|jgi:anti-sigma factor (TIGR02949 family)|nr:zf-HC2 domain-containing protein [Vicinamibacterales bacterium]MDP7470951.1 zf-HC2 domain-containing protein [Vicinamibacterales bacterium]MDP7671856.1 zf-HC2 domain-containing protein [Vicinamibacterales bacterium]HJO38628.1 zf-HC2 domain-containing protein [Vicinamibacterales bacterium]|tara:strand:- start:3191 stop:3430 length:240 start_codon:yes stop_codon:yes gene_type:complete
MVASPCARVVDLLADYLEERLPANVRAELDRHLDRCPACLKQVQTYRSTVSLLRSLGDDDLPSELRSSLRAFLDRGSAN